ncbi:MAG TPA: hypothetical protein VGH93_02580 [Solirubrobacteraceae bacterium]
MSKAPLEHRRPTVSGVDRLGAYLVLQVDDPDGPEPEPGQFVRERLKRSRNFGGKPSRSTFGGGSERLKTALPPRIVAPC